MAAYRTVFKLSHVLEGGEELKLLLLVIISHSLNDNNKSNRNEEIATVYYSKESCIVILNLMEMYMLNTYKYCCLIESSKSIVLKCILSNLKDLLK